MKEARVSIRFPKGVHEQVRKLAYECHISVNSIYAQGIEYFLKALESKKTKIERKNEKPENKT